MSVPNAEHDLEILLLCGREGVLGELAVCSCVSAHNLGIRRSLGYGVEVGFVVGLALALSARHLRAQREAHSSSSGYHGGSRGQSRGCDGRKTHGCGETLVQCDEGRTQEMMTGLTGEKCAVKGV